LSSDIPEGLMMNPVFLPEDGVQHTAICRTDLVTYIYIYMCVCVCVSVANISCAFGLSMEEMIIIP